MHAKPSHSGWALTKERNVELLSNEIRDFQKRAPKRFIRTGRSYFNAAAVRYRWLAEISRGTIDERIQRRAGIPIDHDRYTAIYKSIRRHARK